MPAMDYSKVADLYDVYVQTDIDVPFFIEEARGCRRVLELTSGSGRLSLPLLEAGVSLSCLDSSPEMLAALRKKCAARGFAPPVYTEDMTAFALPERFDLILIPFNAFAEITTPEAQRQALQAIHRHLEPGGRFICTLHNPPAPLARRGWAVTPARQIPATRANRLAVPSSPPKPTTRSRPWSAARNSTNCTTPPAACRPSVSPTSTLRSTAAPPSKRWRWRPASPSKPCTAITGRAAFQEESSPFMIWDLVKTG